MRFRIGMVTLLASVMGIGAFGFSATPAVAQCQVFPNCDMCTVNIRTNEVVCINCTFVCEQ